MATVSCSLCGSKVNAETSHCPDCGADPRLNAEEARADLAARGISTPVSPPPRRTAAQRRRLYTVASVVLLAFVAGVVWGTPHYFSTSQSLSVVAFPGPHHAWVGGDYWTNGGTSIAGGIIHATVDGGANWTKQTSPTQWSDPVGIAFANARCGWMVESWQQMKPYTVLATTDGGATWRVQDLGTPASISGIACADSAHAWAVGDGVVVATTDGGAHWRQQYTTKAGGPGGLLSVACADARYGWAVGDGIILATDDGGARWKRQGRVSRYYLDDVACTDADHAWVVGEDGSNRGVTLATANGGATWGLQFRCKDGLSSLAFTDVRHGWAVGFDGTLLATTDGGDSWTSQHSGTSLDLQDVAFADDLHGIVVGDSFSGDDPLAEKLNGCIILRTTDGGVTWMH